MSTTPEATLRVQQLFVRHQGQLKAFLLALRPNFALVEDVLQEVFLTVSSRAAEFEPETNFLAWARSIARFKLLEALRRRPDVALDAETIASLAAACPDNWGEDAKLAALSACLTSLAPKAQEIIRLRYHREHSPPEIARLLSRSVNSIAVALAKARVALRDCIQQQLQRGRA